MQTTTENTLPTHCPHCQTAREHRTCVDCGAEALVIDCGHYAQPSEIAGTYTPRVDGTPSCGDAVCADCQAAREDALGEIRRPE